MLMTASPTSLELKAKLFRGLGEPSRLAILETLGKGPKTVSEIVAATRLSQPNVSNHLACLRDCGLVRSEPSGRYVTYALSDDRVAGLLALGEEVLAEVARGVYECTRVDRGAASA
jgi:DNA-binding transcriptional ArsR family regulator